jgi:hypothetical protein
VNSLDIVRDLARWSRLIVAIVGALIGLASITGLAWVHRASSRRALLVLGITMAAAGTIQIALWWVASRLVPTPFDDATASGSSSWRLPAGLRALLADVQQALSSSVMRSVTAIGLVVLIPGALLMVVSLAWKAPRARVTIAWVAGAVALVVIGLPFASLTVAGAPDERACNGHRALCSRRYDDVVFAATHNAMSSPDVVKVWPEQDEDLRDQLDSGVRALLIDSHYWLPVHSPTDLIDAQQAIDVAEPLLPKSVADALYPLLGTLRDGRDGTFLCHLQCVFGAIPFVDAMVTVRQFLEANPDDVVTLIIQDAVSATDTARAVHDAGLDDYLFQHRAGDAWPTLGAMIDSGRRLVVFAERAGPPPGWYANAFEEMQETPFTVTSPETFSCVANRGRSDAPLLLMNHWVARVPPDRVNASIVNQQSFLVDRARECERERGLRPNFIAVDFSNIGDVVAAVAELNGGS